LTMGQPEIAARRIGAALMAVIGGVVFYFERGLVAAILWVVVIAVAYAAVMRWLPLWATAYKDRR
jgi:hypothetical protein